MSKDGTDSAAISRPMGALSLAKLAKYGRTRSGHHRPNAPRQHGHGWASKNTAHARYFGY